MSRSRNCKRGGIRVGGNKTGKGPGFEFWSRRNCKGGNCYGPTAKDFTHRKERRDSRRIEREATINGEG